MSIGIPFMSLPLTLTIILIDFFLSLYFYSSGLAETGAAAFSTTGFTASTLGASGAFSLGFSGS